MISLLFLKRVATLPWAVAVAIVQYYTTGTVYQKTNAEFKNSLYKNLHLAVEYHLANSFSREDVARFVYIPASAHFQAYRTHPMAVGLANFGEKITAEATWIVRNGTGKNAVLFLHGGGFCLNVFAAQFVGIMALYYAVPESSRDKLSIAIVDYSLTCHHKKYPTQIHETMEAYRALVKQGFTLITLVGDSAGTNLAAAVARYIAYPEEAAAQFSQYKEFDWDFSAVPQPNLVFISPWLEPYTMPTLMPGVDTTGDLGALDTIMGDWYVEGLDRTNLDLWAHFTNTTYSQHWEKVSAFNGTGRSILIYGEREILRDGVERFVDIISKDGKMEVHMEKGGIHDGMFYVESLDYLGHAGALRAVEGDFAGKYGYTLVGQFLQDILE